MPTRPGKFRGAVRTPSQADRHGLQCGYYAWRQPVAGVGGVRHIRCIVLDTRSPRGFLGRVDVAQLGWLYRELADSLAAREPVLLFAHHPPRQIFGNLGNRRALGRVLEGFPHIVAYFYGHVHRNREALPDPADDAQTGAEEPPQQGRGRFALIGTGSLAGFPQTGRQVELFMPRSAPDAGAPGAPMTVVLRWRHVRPHGDTSRPGGAALQSALDASQRGAIQDLPSVPAPVVDPRPARPDSFEAWAAEHLRPGEARVSITFLSPPAPEDCFGKSGLEETRALRAALGLMPVQADYAPASSSGAPASR
jgi:hypothetical protein